MSGEALSSGIRYTSRLAGPSWLAHCSVNLSPDVPAKGTERHTPHVAPRSSLSCGKDIVWTPCKRTQKDLDFLALCGQFSPHDDLIQHTVSSPQSPAGTSDLPKAPAAAVLASHPGQASKQLAGRPGRLSALPAQCSIAGLVLLYLLFCYY